MVCGLVSLTSRTREKRIRKASWLPEFTHEHMRTLHTHTSHTHTYTQREVIGGWIAVDFSHWLPCAGEKGSLFLGDLNLEAYIMYNVW